MFVNPAVGHSVERVHALAALFNEMNVRAAVDMVAIWQALPQSKPERPKHQPLARVGLLLAEGGQYRGKRIIPAAWIEDILTRGDRDAWNAGDFERYFPGLPIHYRSKWYVLRGNAPLMFGYGVFGQYLFVDKNNEIVIAKLSSSALPMDEERIMLTMHGVEAMRSHILALQHA